VLLSFVRLDIIEYSDRYMELPYAVFSILQIVWQALSFDVN